LIVTSNILPTLMLISGICTS